MKRLIGLIVAMVMVIWCSSAMAVDQSACVNFPHNWANNITCEGLLDAEEVANLDPMDFASHNFSPVTNDFSLWPQPVDNSVIVDEYRLDNRRHPDGRISSKFMLHGIKGTMSIPRIWKMKVTEPQDTDCSDGYCDFMSPIEPNGTPTLSFPTYIYHADFEIDNFVNVGFTDPVIPEGCNENGTIIDESSCLTYNQYTCPEGPFAPPYTAYCDYETTFPGDTDPVGGGPCYDINASVDCSPDYTDCPNCFDVQPSCTAFFDPMDPNDPNDDRCGYYLPMIRTIGGSPLLMSDIVNIESSLGKAAPWYEENDNALIIKYNTGNNQLPNQYGETYVQNDAVYFHEFGDFHFPVGVHTFTVNLVGGESFTLDVNVTSNEVMPTVKATNSYTTVVADKVNKSGKITKATETTVTVPNITAREITDVNGDTRLLIQWAEPDGAMTLVNDTRLRIYVGNDWNNGPTVKDMSFLFLDVPVQSGSVVVPPDTYSWIKDEMIAKGKTSFDIAGMYREQAGPYHNRGFMEKIVFDFPTPQ